MFSGLTPSPSIHRSARGGSRVPSVCRIGWLEVCPTCFQGFVYLEAPTFEAGRAEGLWKQTWLINLNIGHPAMTGAWLPWAGMRFASQRWYGGFRNECKLDLCYSFLLRENASSLILHLWEGLLVSARCMWYAGTLVVLPALGKASLPPPRAGSVSSMQKPDPGQSWASLTVSARPFLNFKNKYIKYVSSIIKHLWA